MASNRTKWIKTGEPTGNNDVMVEIRTTYQTGPQESRDDDVKHGTAEIEIFELIQNNQEIQNHRHDDGSIMFSALSCETQERLMETITLFDRVEELILKGCSPTEAIDYHAVENKGWSQSSWARNVRDVDPSSVSENVNRAHNKIE